MTGSSYTEQQYLAAQDKFFLDVARGLMGCQLVEQELKLYISQAFELVRKRMGNRLPFHFSGDDLANDGLGRLVSRFAKLTNNKRLVRDLEAFVKHRNKLSHVGISRCLDMEHNLDATTAEAYAVDLERIASEAERLRLDLHEEANNFRGFLWFEDES